METLPNVIQDNLQKIWDPTCGSVCIPPLPPASTIHVMATRSAEHGNRYITSGLEESVCYAFPPFSLIGRALRKMQKDQTKLIIVTPTSQGQPWYPTLLKMAIADPFLLPKHQNILLNPEGQIHPLIQNSTLRLVARPVSGKTYFQREYQKGLLTLS